MTVSVYLLYATWKWEQICAFFTVFIAKDFFVEPARVSLVCVNNLTYRVQSSLTGMMLFFTESILSAEQQGGWWWTVKSQLRRLYALTNRLIYGRYFAYCIWHEMKWNGVLYLLKTSVSEISQRKPPLKKT